MEKNVNKEILDFYRKSLPHGYKKKIAEELGVSASSIQSFLNGRSRSRQIENAILKTMVGLKEEREDLLKRAGLG